MFTAATSVTHVAKLLGCLWRAIFHNLMRRYNQTENTTDGHNLVQPKVTRLRGPYDHVISSTPAVLAGNCNRQMLQEFQSDNKESAYK